MRQMLFVAACRKPVADLSQPVAIPCDKCGIACDMSHYHFVCMRPNCSQTCFQTRISIYINNISSRTSSARLATRRQSPVNRGRAHRGNRSPHQWIKHQPTMPLHRSDENRQQRLQSLAAHPVGGFPKQDQCLANCLPIDSPARPQCIPRTCAL